MPDTLTRAVTVTALIAACVACWLCRPGQALAQDYAYWYARAQDKVYRTSPLPAEYARASLSQESPLGPLRVSAAQAEFEGRQIVIRPFSGAVSDVWIEPSGLVCRSGVSSASAIPTSAITVYKVQDVYIKTPSYGYSRKGWQPDPLIPMTLSDGRPLGSPQVGPPNPGFRSVSAGRTQPFYVLFHVPDGCAAGAYEGILTITARDSQGEALPGVRVPVRLTVYPFSIRERTLKTSFGVSMRWGVDTYGDWRPWFRLMSEHRISPQTTFPAWDRGSDWRPPNDSGAMRARADFLADCLSTGAATTFDGERYGFDSVRMPEQESRPGYITNPFGSAASQASAARYYSTMRSAFLPWLSKAYVYPIDEPPGSKRAFVERYGALVHRYAPGAKFLVTVDPVSFDYRPIRNVDIYVHKLHYFYRDYSKWIVPLRRAGKSVWIYSHQTRQQGGSPMYLIDKPLTDSRAQGWFAYHTGADGLMYFSINRWVSAVRGSNSYRDPYADPLSMMSTGDGFKYVANGEGSLTYPGYYPRLGLTMNDATPVGSLRLEALRDGLEDYEYIKLLEKRSGKAAALRQVKRIIGAPKTVVSSGKPTFPAYPANPTPYETVRASIAALVSP